MIGGKIPISHVNVFSTTNKILAFIACIVHTGKIVKWFLFELWLDIILILLRSNSVKNRCDETKDYMVYEPAECVGHLWKCAKRLSQPKIAQFADTAGKI